MFDLAWSEIAVIGLVSVLVLGPKELPQAMRTMAKMVRKMRSLTAELQGHMNEIVRDAELEEMRQSVKKLSTTNIQDEVAKAVDPTGELTAQLTAPLIEEPPPVSGEIPAQTGVPVPAETAQLSGPESPGVAATSSPPVAPPAAAPAAHPAASSGPLPTATS